MRIEKQVCNENYADKLKELGIAQISLYYHTNSPFGIAPRQSIDFSIIPTSAFTCAELVQMNGNIYGIDFSENKQKFFYGNAIDKNIVYFDSFADILAAKLINALEKEWLSIIDANNRLLKK